MLHDLIIKFISLVSNYNQYTTSSIIILLLIKKTNNLQEIFIFIYNNE